MTFVRMTSVVVRMTSAFNWLYGIQQTDIMAEGNSVCSGTTFICRCVTLRQTHTRFKCQVVPLTKSVPLEKRNSIYSKHSRVKSRRLPLRAVEVAERSCSCSLFCDQTMSLWLNQSCGCRRVTFCLCLYCIDCCQYCALLLRLQVADCDNLLTNQDVLWKLMTENNTIVAPMLESRAAYSNFWCGMTSQVRLL